MRAREDNRRSNLHSFMARELANWESLEDERLRKEKSRLFPLLDLSSLRKWFYYHFFVTNDYAMQTVPSAPKIQQSRPQAITSSHQLAQMQTMRPRTRAVMSTPQGFRKPQMTQATVKMNLSKQSIIAWHFNYFCIVFTFSSRHWEFHRSSRFRKKLSK